MPPGDYFVQVCDFPDGAAWASPRTYDGTVTIDDSPAPPAYWARWKAFPATPPLSATDQYPWGNPSTDTRKTWCWRSAPGCDIVVGNLASRVPWDFDGRTNTTTFTTSGNNNKAATAWDNASAPGAPGYMPTSNPNRDYSFPWTNDWNNRQCQRAATETPGAVYDDSAAVTNLFVMHNRMHDFSYFLGFTEQNWNAQSSNFGNTESWQEGDPLIGDAQSGAQTTTRDNANMSTMPDGASSVTNMYFWQPIAGSFYAPCVDGDYDQGVIGHEFTHMIENRMIGKGSHRAGFHAGSMGEAFGDLVSTEYLRENSYTPTDGEDPFATGTYATGNKEHGIRNYVMNWARTGDFPMPVELPARQPAELQRHRLRRGRERGPLGRRDLGGDQQLGQAGPDRQVQRRLPGRRRGSPGPVRLRRAALPELPGQPALDPAAVRLLPARPDRTDLHRRAQLDCSRPT